MKVDVVVDVGNTRIKWGRCGADSVVELASLEPNNFHQWMQQFSEWRLHPRTLWAISGVHPERQERLVKWLQGLGSTVLVLNNHCQLPIVIRLPIPDRVGIDRLLNAVAARNRATRYDGVIIVDAGTAVTVDVLDETGAFCGGTIMPGFRLMSEALHDHTAALPVTEVREPNPPIPGTDTMSAIQGGVYWAVVGGVRALLPQLAARCGRSRRVEVFVTGGDAHLLLPMLEPDVRYWPEMTLEGIRISAEHIHGGLTPPARQS